MKAELNKACYSVVILGASGAVGTQVVHKLIDMQAVPTLTLLGRKQSMHRHQKINDNVMDVCDASSYESLLDGHEVAICTLGVGEPSKVSRLEFTKIDHDAVLTFAKACKRSGVKHFQLLSSVAVDPNSRSFYLKSKGQLNAAIDALGFEKLSIFHPSMIETPTNRYGLSQAVALRLSRIMKPILIGRLKQFRGIEVSTLGQSMAINSLRTNLGGLDLYWQDFHKIVNI